MKSWPEVVIPAIPGHSEPLRVYDSRSRSLVAVSGTDGRARLYVCGITPYDATHLGHAATYVTFDLIHRSLLDQGVAVDFIQNVTDVDDPLLERAARDGVDWTELAHSEIALFREDMTALGVLPPAELVGVVESMEIIAACVRKVIASGAAYGLSSDDAEGEDIYLDLSAAPDFGEVSHWSREQMDAVIVDRGGDPDRPGKRHPLDPLLWRAARVGEPSWSPEGLPPGRPGWHIECTAIAADRLGLPFDVQGGGSDLVFPHHDMSAAQAQVLGEQFAHSFVHQAMVGLDGAKMSKSKGNLVLVSALRAQGVDPMAIRLLLLAHPYDADWDYTDADLALAQSRLETWRAGLSVNAGPAAESTIAAIRAAVADNLDTPAALTAVDTWVASSLADATGDNGAPGVLARTIDAVLGVRL